MFPSIFKVPCSHHCQILIISNPKRKSVWFFSESFRALEQNDLSYKTQKWMFIELVNKWIQMTFSLFTSHFSASTISPKKTIQCRSIATAISHPKSLSGCVLATPNLRQASQSSPLFPPWPTWSLIPQSPSWSLNIVFIPTTGRPSWRTTNSVHDFISFPICITMALFFLCWIVLRRQDNLDI